MRKIRGDEVKKLALIVLGIVVLVGAQKITIVRNLVCDLACFESLSVQSRIKENDCNMVLTCKKSSLISMTSPDGKTNLVIRVKNGEVILGVSQNNQEVAVLNLYSKDDGIER